MSPSELSCAPALDDEQERTARLLLLDERPVSGASLDASLAPGLDEYERSGADSPLSREGIVSDGALSATSAKVPASGPSLSREARSMAHG
jgi:hypothetical protein